MFIRIPFGGAGLLFGGATICRIRLSQPKRTCHYVHRQFGVSAMPEALQR